MKLVSMTLRNFRGIDERRVEFGPGVTIVEGPNEVGKSCFTEALDLLFDYLDSSRRASVKAVGPVHRDAGPEVEVEIECGDYAFRYFKRFLKSPATELTVREPSPENLTGREAHERVKAILSGSVDLDLWKALRVQQGTELALPDLQAKGSLASALDRAAGQARAGEREETLLEAVRDEYGRYFTPKGKERKPLSGVDANLRKEESDLAEIRRQLARAEEATVRAEELDERIRRLTGERAQREAESRDAADLLARVERLEREAEQKRSLLEAAGDRLELERRRAEERGRLVEEIGKRSAEIEESEERLESLGSVLREAKKEEQAARVELKAEEARVQAEEESLSLRKRDFEHRRNELDLRLLSQRRDRIARADADAQAARKVVETNSVDEDLLSRIREAHVDLERARAASQAGGASLSVEALHDVELEIGDEPHALAEGETVDAPVEDELSVVVPGSLRFVVRPGRGAGDLASRRIAAQEELEALLARAGSADLKDAARKRDERAAAERTLAELEERRQADLGDLTFEDICKKVESLTSRVEAYRSSRAPEPPLPPDFDAAQDAVRREEETSRDRIERLEKARKRTEEAKTRSDALDLEASKLASDVELRKGARESATTRLKGLRNEVSDDELRHGIEGGEKRLAECRKEAEEAATALSEADPDRVRRAAEGAAAALSAARDALHAREGERAATQGALDELGGRGLTEEAEKLESRLEVARREQAAVRRRAQAARLLFLTLERHREQAQMAYQEPLARRIEELGGIVYGKGFSVELDERLSVSTRTLPVDGRAVTLPYASLSGGAKEQLSLLARLACALIVSEEGGVPLIFDDALGYTDEDRLRRMAAVFSVAGRHCQVVVLTCVPDRYGHVAEAKRVPM